LNINKKGLKIGGSIGAPHGEGEVAEVQLEDGHTHVEAPHVDGVGVVVTGVRL
jgi:hypothetical protein